MRLGPSYDGPPMLVIEGADDDQLEPLTRQRRRLQSLLRELTDEQWMAPSRCERWTVRDVVAHLVGVNAFWHASVRAGLAGNPTRVLGAFDPVTTPLLMVDSMQDLTAADVLTEFESTNEAFLGIVAGVTSAQWSTTAETPVGHVPLRLLAQHALWDCWIHERDIAVPLGIATTNEADEVESCLKYAAAIGATLQAGLGRATPGSFAVAASDPDVRFVVEVGNSVSICDDHESVDGSSLRGDAATLAEVLSLRAPMPPEAPAEWKQLLESLATAFAAE